jgi:hypothetical protein
MYEAITVLWLYGSNKRFSHHSLPFKKKIKVFIIYYQFLKVTFHLYLHSTKTVQVFSDRRRLAAPTSLPWKGFSSLLQQNEDQTRTKEDMVFRRSNLNLDLMKGSPEDCK